MMYVRPAGKRVVLWFRGDKVVILNKQGKAIKVITSNYLISHQKSILEGIIDEDDPTKIYITDVIQWKGDFKVGE